MTEFQEYVAYWRRKVQQQPESNQQLAKPVRIDLSPIVEVLVQPFGATPIILFGALAKDIFAEDSDIDLAVAEIPLHRFFVALVADVWHQFEQELKTFLQWLRLLAGQLDQQRS